MTEEPIKLPTLSGRATAEFCKAQRAAARKERRVELKAKRAELRGDVAVPDPAALRAWELFQRETLDFRQSAANMAEQILSIPADAPNWLVKRDCDTAAHMEADGLSFTAYKTMNLRTGTTLTLGVRLAGSTAPLVDVASLEELGAFLAKSAPPRPSK